MRKELFSSSGLWQLLIFGILIIPFAASSQIHVDQQRLEQLIFKLAEFGLQDNGETERVAFSEADLASRAWVIEEMNNLQLKTSIDYAGNIIGVRKGKNPGLKPIAFGSHIDRVPNGGNYDGCVGAMAALEVIRTLNDNNMETLHPLEVIIFSNEEGGVMGSRAMVGHLSPAALEVVNSTGYSMGEGITRLGGDTTKLDLVKRKKGEITAFLELHIEQGGILDREQVDIGIVEGIVGLKWWEVTFEGFANHAGTTPMDLRQDALLAAAKFIVAVNEITNSFDGKQVGTVGRISAAPGAPNVIPGKVVTSLEIRDLSAETITALYNAIEQKGFQIAKEANVAIEFKLLDTTADPALTDKGIQQRIAKAATKLGLSFKQMQSGAGHDAQDMALIAPTGMIFVPSKDGISHSPKEFTTAADMAHGANVLLHTLLSIDREFD